MEDINKSIVELLNASGARERGIVIVLSSEIEGKLTAATIALLQQHKIEVEVKSEEGVGSLIHGFGSPENESLPTLLKRLEESRPKEQKPYMITAREEYQDIFIHPERKSKKNKRGFNNRTTFF